MTKIEFQVKLVSALNELHKTCTATEECYFVTAVSPCLIWVGEGDGDAVVFWPAVVSAIENFVETYRKDCDFNIDLSIHEHELEIQF